MKNIFEGKTILITGASGTLGSVLCESLLKLNPYSIRALDIDENGLFYLRERLGDDRIRYLLGDVQNYNRVEMAMHRADIVIHLAAIKHVRIASYNPEEVINTNVKGTLNVLKAAIKNDVERVVYMSTDKAVYPSTIYGVTKLLGEYLTCWASDVSIPDKKFCIVRPGNFLPSRGSVIPKWYRQKITGKPITVVPDMYRFMIPLVDIAGFTMDACANAKHKEIWIPKMPVLNIKDLADVISGNQKIINKEPNEKEHEWLMTLEESRFCNVLDDKYKIHPTNPIREEREFSTKTSQLIGREEIKKMLEAMR